MPQQLPKLLFTGLPVTLQPTWMNQVVMSTLPDGSVQVIRRDDLLVLRFEFLLMTVQPGTDGYNYLQPSNPGNPGQLVVHFQTQAIAEPVYPSGAPSTLPVSPVNAAGNTQIALEIPVASFPLRLTLENLLNWASFTLNLAPVALTEQQAGTIGSNPPQISDPTMAQRINDLTYIQAPPRLYLSPDSNATWQHQLGIQPNGAQNETELWHTVLTPIAGTQEETRLRAIWSPDYTPTFTPTNVPSPYTLDADQRNQIVHLCSDYTLGEYVSSMPADRLALTALGAWMEIRGEWPVGQEAGTPPPNIQHYAVSGWHTRATMAREHFVMLVQEGHLYPFGHRAALVTITERSDPSPTMYLGQTQYLVVRDRVRDLTATGASAASLRQMPFQQVELLTKRTPLLDAKSSTGPSFWPTVGGYDFLFDLVGTDVAGQACSFQSPLYFIEDTVTLNQAVVTVANAGLEQNPAALCGQPLALVPPTSAGGVDTSYPAQQLTFAGVLDGAYPGFVPVVISASLFVPAIHQLTNVEAPVQVQYTQSYLSQGIQNEALPYAQITQGAPTLKFASADQSGGLAQPSFTLTHLARSTGLAPLDAAAANAPSLQSIFGNFNLLGGISLGDLLPVSAGAGTTPTIKTSTDPTSLTATTEMAWTLTPSTLQSAGPFEVSSGTQIELQITRVQGPQASQNSTTIHCELDSFTLSLLSLIDVQFNSFTFDHQPGQKPNIIPDVAGTTFNAPLDFIQSLASIIPGNGFSNPPTMDIEPTGATLGYTLSLPPIELGEFSLENINLSSSLSIPFTSSPIVFSFAFASADAPFLLTADFITGGGYCTLELLPTGLQRLDAALEFGGSAQLDLGVDGGGVTTTGGFHFGLDQTNGTTDYTVFVQASGSLEVLDLISVSTEFYVGLDYQTSQTFTGTASLTVEVSVLFFHKSVSLTMQKSYTS